MWDQPLQLSCDMTDSYVWPDWLIYVPVTYSHWWPAATVMWHGPFIYIYYDMMSWLTRTCAMTYSHVRPAATVFARATCCNCFRTCCNCLQTLFKCMCNMKESSFTYNTAHTWMCRVTLFGTHMNESCHAYEWVAWHVWTSHVTHVSESCTWYQSGS